MEGAMETQLKIHLKLSGVIAASLMFLSLIGASTAFAASPKMPRRLKVGTSIPLLKITPETMRHAKSVGIDCIEVGMSGFKVGDSGDAYFIQNKDEAIRQVQQAKKAAEDAGVEIWSVHMPAGSQFEISKGDEQERRKVVDFQKQVIVSLVSILHPKIVLFHPSFFIPKNEKQLRMQQLLKSSRELDAAVKSIGATMVLENMNDASDKHMVLMQRTKDIVETFNLLPADIYSAIDLNHINHPEQLIRALGKRVKTLHVSDGTGIQEEHWFPCSGKGVNNWVAILSALNDTGYSGPFMFEVKPSEYSDFRDLTSCYDKMYSDYVRSLSKR
ncbi:MAG TPA: sugar phosphate isomerase/epimerase family protein [Edaphobacter sp.]|nr:sugar phosphate isomerase/epimerase family protein [Edaphobacter sp.]